MSDRSEIEILARLSSDEAETAWTQFLEIYSPLIYKVARQLDRDEERVADCYLYVCERLHRNRYRRLRRFRAGGRARFSTWLWAVVRNLGLDWRRQALGAPRLFRAISRRSPLEQEVFRCLYHQGLTLDETLGALRGPYPRLDSRRLEEIVTALHQRLSGRQFWLLSTSRPRVRSLSARSQGGGTAPEETLADDSPDPETTARIRQRRVTVEKALSSLPAADRLLVRLRYLTDLPLREVARLAGLDSPQAAARGIERALSGLREEVKAGEDLGDE